MVRFPRSFLLALVASATLITGCTETKTPASTPASPSSSPTPTAQPVETSEITLEASSGVSTDLDKQPLVVKSTVPLVSLQLSGEGASAVKWEKVSPKEWHGKGVLKFSSPYLLTVVDETQVKTVPVTTLTPEDTVSPTLFPYEGTMGVGMPITVNFREAIKDKKWTEEHLKVTTTPKVEGSWGWLDAERAVWRPKDYWKPGTKVSVHVDLEGVETAPGEFGKRDVSGDFTVGRAVKMEINNASKSLKYFEGGKLLKEMPVSLGKASTQTSTGTSIIYEKQNPVRMVGEGYDQMVDYAQRITTSGQYLHSAPWSVASQGNTNVSHGCINIGPANAKWLYEQTIMGDVVEVKGTDRPLEGWNGMGAVWNYSWEEWQSLAGK